MMIIFENRASKILFNFLKSNYSDKKFILPPNVCPVIPLIFLKAKCKFEFCDIEKDTYCISKQLLLNKLYTRGNEYAGLLYVRTYGLDTDQNSFFSLLKEMNPSFIIIDDKCLCIPTFNNNQNVADLILYSTGYAKFVDFGYGGYGYISNESNYLQSFSNSRTFPSENLKSNYKIQIENLEHSLKKRKKYKYVDNHWLDLSGLIDSTKYVNDVLVQVKKEAKHRLLINSIYDHNLPDEIKFPKEFQDWRYNILVRSKNLILREIFKNRLFASSHYQTIGYAFTNEIYRESDNLFSQVINLFNNRKITVEMAKKLCEIVNFQ